MSTFKFTVYDFAGEPYRHYLCEELDLHTTKPTKKRQPAHHCMIVDASGSMYNDMPDVRATLEKICTLDEYNNPDLRLSLISFSSSGDVKLHFSKVTVADVMKKDSPYLKSIQTLQVRAMTGMSQSLKLAESIIDDADITAISLHTDGYANDPSPSAEHAAIEVLIGLLKKHPNLFVNTIGYRDWCDYNLLAKIANSLSGTCLQAKNIKQVYDSLNGTTALLTGTMAPTLELSKGDADYLVFRSSSAKKILGSKDALFVRGLAENDDKTAWRLKEVDEKTLKKEKCSTLKLGSTFSTFARAFLGMGQINLAKYFMTTSLIEDLRKHTRALVSADIAAMAADLEAHAFGKEDVSFVDKYALASSGPALLDLFQLFNEHRDGFLINIAKLKEGYKRRGLKKEQGVRLENGKVEPTWTDTKFRDDSEWVETSGFELNNANATINVLISRPVDLTERKTEKRIGEVAGIKLNDLRTYNNYTIVGDGMLNTDKLTVRVTDKALYEQLKKMGEGLSQFDPGEVVTMNLNAVPIVDYSTQFKNIDVALFENLMQLTVLQKALKAICAAPEAKPRFSSEQLEELKKHYITPALYYSPPTCNPYVKLEDAIAKGEVDYRVSFRVTLGTKECLHLGELYSGNEYLQRRFTLSIGGKDVAKPTWDAWLNDKAQWGIKELSARTKLNSIDEVTYPIYAGFLNLGPGGPLEKLIDTVVPAKKLNKLEKQLSESSIEGVQELLELVEKKIETLYHKQLRPLVFQVGASGIVPDSFGATAYTPDQYEQKFDVKLGKNEKQGTFFVLPNGLVLSVFTENVLFST